MNTCDLCGMTFDLDDLIWAHADDYNDNDVPVMELLAEKDLTACCLACSKDL